MYGTQLLLLKSYTTALIGVAQWVGCCPENGKVNSLIPGQGTGLGC